MESLNTTLGEREKDYIDRNYRTSTITNLTRDVGATYAAVQGYLKKMRYDALKSYNKRPLKPSKHYVKPDDGTEPFVRPPAVYSNPDYKKMYL